MTHHNYIKMRDGLALDNFKNSEIIYDFKGHLYEDIFDYLFQSFKTYLNLLKDDTYDVSPVAIYFTKYTTVNARAGYDGKYYIIEINRGTVEQLYNMFFGNRIFGRSDMGAYNEIKNILKEKRGIEIEQLMFEVSQLFTFYHETGHIIQLYNMNLLNALGAENIISEQYNFIEDSEYDLLRHIKEFDADIHGSTHIANHIIALCIDLKGDMTYDNFFRLVVIFLVSISCYIMFLWQSFNKDMYYDEGTHPHPVIRLFWILATMLAYLEKPFFDLDQKAVLNEVNRVLSIFAENADLHDTIKHFDNIRNTEYQHIKNYCDKIMKDSESIEYLSVNTYLPYKYSK